MIDFTRDEIKNLIKEQFLLVEQGGLLKKTEPAIKINTTSGGKGGLKNWPVKSKGEGGDGKKKEDDGKTPNADDGDNTGQKTVKLPKPKPKDQTGAKTPISDPKPKPKDQTAVRPPESTPESTPGVNKKDEKNKQTEGHTEMSITLGSDFRPESSQYITTYTVDQGPRGKEKIVFNASGNVDEETSALKELFKIEDEKVIGNLELTVAKFLKAGTKMSSKLSELKLPDAFDNLNVEKKYTVVLYFLSKGYIVKKDDNMNFKDFAAMHNQTTGANIKPVEFKKYYMSWRQKFFSSKGLEPGDPLLAAINQIDSNAESLATVSTPGRAGATATTTRRKGSDVDPK
jgi:hypothetical protein